MIVYRQPRVSKFNSPLLGELRVGDQFDDKTIALMTQITLGVDEAGVTLYADTGYADENGNTIHQAFQTRRTNGSPWFTYGEFEPRESDVLVS